MNLIGRYAKTRGVQPDGSWTPPYIIDYKNCTMLPAGGEEWWTSPSGLTIPVPRGGIGGVSGEIGSNTTLNALDARGGPVQNTQAFNAASGYTFGSAGNAIAARVQQTTDFVLTNVYYYMSATNGTAGNITNCIFQLRDDNGSGTGPQTSGGTLFTSGSADPHSEAAMVGWHKITPTQFTMVAGTIYWAIFTKTSQSATDYPTVAISSSLINVTIFNTSANMFKPMFTSTNGFSTAVSDSNTGIFLLEDSTGNIRGNSLITNAVTTNNTNRRGLFFSLKDTLNILAMGSVAAAGISGMEIYDTVTGTVPGTGALRPSTTFTLAPAGNRPGALFLPAFPAQGGVPYRFVFTYGSAGNVPTKWTMGVQNGYTTQTRAAKSGGANWYFAGANGTTDWSNDDQDAYPGVTVFVDDQIATEAAGGRIFTGM